MATRGTSVALPELFSDGEIILWLRKFELCSTVNGWKEDDMLKRLPTLLAGKAFAVYERLPVGRKEGYENLIEALSTAFGGDEMGKHIAMMSFRSRMRKPDEDMQVFAYNLETLLRRAMPKIGDGDRGILTQKVSELTIIVANVHTVQTPNVRGRRGPCYQCGKMGHIASECRGKGSSNQRSSYQQRQGGNYCFVCGEMGHFARGCSFRFQASKNNRYPRPGNGEGQPPF